MSAPAQRRVDAHAHLIPPAYLRAITAPGGPPPPLPSATRAELEAMMQANHIERAVISTGPPGAAGRDTLQRSRVARIANEEIAAIVHDAPQRFAGLAVLPLPDAAKAVEEIAYALDELHLDGVMLLSNAGGVYLGDAAYEAVFDELDRRGAYVFLHPGYPPQPPPLQHPVWLYEFPFETTRAVANLIYSGTLERHPRIRLQLAHLGGTVPFIAHRLASLSDREPAQATGAPAGALEYLSRLFYDTGLSNNAPALASIRAMAGLDRVVFGTDWPYAALPAAGDPAPGLGVLSIEERDRVDAGNIGALVPRWAST
jgi:predicted TIM-barrel fold metal-dependent hydrolase